MIVKGYCQTKEQAILLRAIGLTPMQIYREGDGAETLKACLASFRDGPGTLFVAAPLTAPLSSGGIEVVGISPDVWGDLCELIDVVSGARSLRRLFNSF